MSFQDQTATFFDELTNIVNEQMKEKHQGEAGEAESPFSSMLTQDEEPTNDQEGVVEPDPEVIVRPGAGATSL